MPTDAETACFEAGIKFGSLYHQFAGTPVSPDSAASLAAAMEAAIENQPHCRDVTVDVLTDELAASIDHGQGQGQGNDKGHGYVELTGRFLSVEIAVEYEGVTVVSRMEMDDGYPRMRIDAIEP